MTRVLVCGGRDFDDAESLYRMLDAIFLNEGISEIIHGCARGADTLAGKWAHGNGVPQRRFPADWNEHGRAAGHIRNQRMLVEGKPDLVVACRGGVGTANMVARAEKAGIEVRRVP